MIGQMLLTAIAAVAAENLIFVGGIGFSRALRAARKPKTMGLYALFVALFALISIEFSSLMGWWLASTQLLRFLRPTLLALGCAIAFAGVSALLKFVFPKAYQVCGQILAPAAINTVVLSMPYAQRAMALEPLTAIAYALGTGVAFFLAAVLLNQVLDRCRNTDMPRAFRGLPATLIYIGILSLAFAGFNGGKLF